MNKLFDMCNTEENNNKRAIISRVENINEFFKLPISYNTDKMAVDDHIITDLELIKTVNAEDTALYNYAFQPKTAFGNKIVEQFARYYTTDVSFLKDSQNLFKTYTPVDGRVFSPDYTNIMRIWDEIKNDTGFKEKYHYIDWPTWEYLNKSEVFLQIMSMYNLASPVLSLLVPVVILVIPFFIIKMKGLALTISEYCEVLKTIASNHAIGKIFTKFNTVNTSEKVYMLLSAGFYLFSIYQNILTCIRFQTNMIKIHSYLNDIKQYIDHTVQNMRNLLKYSDNLTSYSEFNMNMLNNIHNLSEFKTKLDIITPYKLSPNKIGNLGHILKCFYELYDNKTCEDCLMYSFGFNGYIDAVEGFIENMKSDSIHCVKFVANKRRNRLVFKNSYYPALINCDPVKNTCNLKKNMIVTGPNASGKTTTLKTTLINVIITQQTGCGFYSSRSSFSPFKYIHCYLNIPDTSGRDSLFQAESRRCKNILDSIKDDNKDSHFCVFDELYSGTNPEEAVNSASAFMSYLIKRDKVTCVLTTHFNKLCENLEKNERIKNYHMHCVGETSITYTYKLKEGISNVHGGIKILRDMNYPQEIIDNANALHDNI